MRELFQEYGWLIVGGIAIVCVIVMISPIGTVVESAVNTTISNLLAKASGAINGI